jgi:hypothetical protein
MVDPVENTVEYAVGQTRYMEAIQIVLDKELLHRPPTGPRAGPSKIVPHWFA